MKTIEQKAKRYDEALKTARKINSGEGVATPPDWTICEVIFPELKESEDEKIKKALIDWFSDKHTADDFRGIAWERIVAWLEKQGEQKPIISDKAKEMFIKALERVEELNNKGYKLTDCDKNSWWEDFKAYTSCIIEQNHAYKVEPKFKVGQWIVWQDKCYKVNYNGCGYELVDQNGLSTSLEYGTIDENAHLLTIQDAKKKSNKIEQSPIDVRTTGYWHVEDVEQKPAWSEEDKYYYGIIQYILNNECVGKTDKEEAINWFKSLKDRVQIKQEWKQENTDDLTDFENAMMHIGGSFFGENAGLDPNNTNAIKEQANLLLELVPKQEWSEEDEIMIKVLDSIIRYIVEIVDKDALEKFGTNREELFSWLKSLIPQNTWKPSNEQMDVLLSEVTAWTKGCPKQIVLESLYNDLKRLLKI